MDISKENSTHAQKIVREFRRGIYAENVDFHVCDVSSFIEDEFEKRQTTEPFLSHVILDLVGPEKYLQRLADAMVTDATLAVFCPNLTQIGDCVTLVQKLKLPFAMDRVVELGASNSAGRLWDVRAVQPRVSSNPQSNETSDDAASSASVPEHSIDSGTVSSRIRDAYDAIRGRPTSVSPNGTHDDESGWRVICRPRTGYFVHGGGFLGLWKRMKY